MYACHFQCLALSLANAIFKGICYLDRDDKSFGIIGSSEIKTLSLLPISVITVAFMTFGPRCAHNVYKRDIGAAFAVSGSCTTSTSSDRNANDVYNRGSGNCYIKYGDCSSSTTSMRSNANFGGIHDIHNEGSGNIYIEHCDASISSVPSNGKELIHNVYNAGSGKIYIKYWCGESASSERSNNNIGRKLMNDLFNAGSSEVYITYRKCCPSTSGAPSDTNICGKLLEDIRSEGSGIIDIKYEDCGASASSVQRNTNNCGKLINNVHQAGSGKIFIKYSCGETSSTNIGRKLMNDLFNTGSAQVHITYRKCCPSTSGVPADTNICGKLMDDIRSGGSGIVDIKYWDCGASTSSVQRNTNNCGKLRVFLVLEYHRLERSPTATRRSFQKRFNVPKGPDAKSICKLFARFERTGSVDDNRVENVGSRQTVVTPENVAKVSGIVQQNPRHTVGRIASETGLKRSSTQTIFRNSRRMFHIKSKVIRDDHTIKAGRQRFDFANEIFTMIDNEGFDVGCIWFTDEAHFHLNGFVNK
ncbi:hypothetical protein AVEN_108978-1 [Araneus ventricosus]|uniref:DUF4817 domain-containing protein n=1 Tax=Araneus ventricosus TaxID=182803 RepID=A0A4Y2F5F1_ARAVE|nr:hypothetical protein AVEN_108978-1 [Araneus ventricosus]